MDPRPHKLYHETSIDARKLIDTYLANKPEIIFKEDFMTIPMEKLYNILKSGLVKGEILTDISFASFIHHLYTACNFFKEIIVLKFSDRCLMELNKWRHDRTGAYDWSHTSDIHKQLEGESGYQEEREIKLKKAITHALRCDNTRENLIDPLAVPPADCLFSAVLLESISRDEADYIKNMRKCLHFLKPGGHLILFALLNASYYMVGEEKFHLFTCDKDFIQKVLIGEGYTIDRCEVLERKSGESPLADFKGLAIVVAHKEQQV